MDRGPRPLRDALAAVAQGLTDADPRTLVDVFGQWEEVAGTAVAAHTRPLRLTDEVLVVAVDQPGWATQVRSLAPSLLAKIAERTGAAPGRVEVVVRRPLTGGRAAPETGESRQ